MTRIHTLFICASCFWIAGCGSGGMSVENALCNEEIMRKAQVSELTIESTEFTGTTKGSDGDVIGGTATITQNGEKKTMGFSCVMQGSGADAVVIRAEFDYSK